MSKVTVKNCHKGQLSIAGVNVRSQATVGIDAAKFRSWSTGNAAKLWLAQGLVLVISEAPEVPTAKAEAPTVETVSAEEVPSPASSAKVTKDKKDPAPSSAKTASAGKPWEK